MKIRFTIDRIVLDELGWSASERRSFERRFATALHEAIASHASKLAVAFNARRVGFESLSIGAIDAGNPRSAAQKLATPLVPHLLGSAGGRLTGRAKGTT